MARRSLEYRFHIDSFSPETLPMAALAEYMGDLAKLLGEEKSVHFVKVDRGSTVLVQRVEWEAIPKVRERVHAVKSREGPPEALKAYDALNKRLAKDNAKADLKDQFGSKVIQFPGRTKTLAPLFGPFNEAGYLDGVLIRIGGELGQVPVHLEEADGFTHMCQANRMVARELAVHIFGPPLRVHGEGRWHRDTEGQWLMDRFTIQSFEVLKPSSLREAVNRVRTQAKSLDDVEDPIARLHQIRHGDTPDDQRVLVAG